MALKPLSFFAQCLLLPAILRICHHRPLSRLPHKYDPPPCALYPGARLPPLFLNPWRYCTVSRSGRRFYRVCKASGGHTDCNKSAPFLTDGSGLLGEPESGGLPSRDAYLSAWWMEIFSCNRVHVHFQRRGGESFSLFIRRACPFFGGGQLRLADAWTAKAGAKKSGGQAYKILRILGGVRRVSQGCLSPRRPLKIRANELCRAPRGWGRGGVGVSKVWEVWKLVEGAKLSSSHQAALWM